MWDSPLQKVIQAHSGRVMQKGLSVLANGTPDVTVTFLVQDFGNLIVDAVFKHGRPLLHLDELAEFVHEERQKDLIGNAEFQSFTFLAESSCPRVVPLRGHSCSGTSRERASSNALVGSGPPELEMEVEGGMSRPFQASFGKRLFSKLLVHKNYRLLLPTPQRWKRA